MSSIWFENTSLSGVQIISYKIDRPALTVLVNLEQLSRNLDIKIIKKILPPNINFIFNIIFLICSYSAKKFLFRQKVLMLRVLIVLKSS